MHVGECGYSAVELGLCFGIFHDDSLLPFPSRLVRVVLDDHQGFVDSVVIHKKFPRRPPPRASANAVSFDTGRRGKGSFQIFQCFCRMLHILDLTIFPRRAFDRASHQELSAEAGSRHVVSLRSPAIALRSLRGVRNEWCLLLGCFHKWVRRFAPPRDWTLAGRCMLLWHAPRWT